MPKIELQVKDRKTIKKIQKIIEGTNIIQRQLELAYGHWDFVVFGRDKNNLVIRKGHAEHLRILDSSAYIVSVVDTANFSGRAQGNSIPIEEFVAGDIPDELRGLDIINVDPLRPLSISSKKTLSMSKGEKLVQDNYADKNIAIIQTPDEKYWSISVLKYLNECDQFFPDTLTQAIKKGQLPVNVRFAGYPQPRNKGFNLH